MNIRSKLLLVLGLAALIIIVQGGWGLWQLRQLGGRLEANLDTGKIAQRMQESAALARITFRNEVQALNDILLRGSDPADRALRMKAFAENEAAVAKALAGMESSMLKANLDVSQVRKEEAVLRELGEKYRVALAGFDPANPASGRMLAAGVRGLDLPLDDGLSELGDEATRFAEMEAGLIRDEVAAFMRQTGWGTVVVVVAVLGSLLLAGWRAVKSIMDSVAGLQQTMLRVGRDWNLGLRAPENGHDELAVCGRVFNRMLTHFQVLVKDVHTKTRGVAEQTGNIAKHLAHVGQSADVQSQSTTAVAAAVEQMTMSINQVGEAAHEAELLAGRTHESAASGLLAVEQGNAQLQRVAAEVDETERILGELGVRSEAISGIVHAVKEIAEQTNLLALNAAIEAARAGDQGRGFSVVADEVRKLAEKTARATDEIDMLVTQIQSSSGRAIDNVQDVVRTFGCQLDLAEKVTDAIRQINHAADQTSEASSRINAAVQEQAAASMLIASQVEQIVMMCEDNLSATREVGRNTQRLDAMAGELSGSVLRFSV